MLTLQWCMRATSDIDDQLANYGDILVRRHPLRQIWSGDTTRLAVPCACYTIMNNLRWVAAAHLTAVMVQLIERSACQTLSTLAAARSIRC